MEYSERIYDVRIFAHYLIECNLSVYLICFTWNSIQKEYVYVSNENTIFDEPDELDNLLRVWLEKRNFLIDSIEYKLLDHIYDLFYVRYQFGYAYDGEYYTLSKPDPTQIVGAGFCILENDPNSSIKPNPASYPNIFFRYRLFCISKYIEYNQIDRKRNPDSWILKNFKKIVDS